MIPGLDRLTRKLILGIACALALALLVHDRNRWKAKTTHYAELLAAERGAHAATIANVRAAAEQGRASDKANAERVKGRQADINQRSDHEFKERLADARAAAGRLRRRGASAPAGPGGGRTAAVPALSLATSGAHQAAREDRLPQPERLIATEQAIQLDELIKWVERQAAVDPGGTAPD
jgi:hypothetical protein